jgi:hypothetical protein
MVGKRHPTKKEASRAIGKALTSERPKLKLSPGQQRTIVERSKSRRHATR